MSEREHDGSTEDDGEVVDALPVGSGEGPRVVPAPSPLAHHEPATTARTVPAAQAAAVAATGFAAGAVTVALLGGISKRRAVHAATKRAATSGGLPIVGSRRFLVDVHLLGPRQ